MTKSKEFIESDDDLSGDEVKKKPVAKKRKNDDSDEESDNGKASNVKEKKPAAKQTNKKQKESEDSDSKGPKDESGNQMYQLARMRFVSVSEFRGKPLVNIREYYEANGKLLPGKKGVSLSTDQWEQLKKFIDKIDNDIKNVSK